MRRSSCGAKTKPRTETPIDRRKKKVARAYRLPDEDRARHADAEHHADEEEHHGVGVGGRGERDAAEEATRPRSS